MAGDGGSNGHGGVSSSKRKEFEPNRVLAHDNHHRLFNVEFGTLGLFDWLYGTTTPLERR